MVRGIIFLMAAGIISFPIVAAAPDALAVHRRNCAVAELFEDDGAAILAGHPLDPHSQFCWR